MDLLIDSVLQTIRENSMIKENDKIIVAVSGGPDSMCLLHILYTLKESLKISLAAAHVNHCLRGQDADEDENYVKNFCKALNIDFYSIRVDVKSLSSERNISSEMAGRAVRYEFFERLKGEINADKIALAHNANDQAETLLMRIMRGTGSEGLIGIKPVRDKLYIRPLINNTRIEIENYCKNNRINARIDKTNLENIYSRNKVRLELIPYIKKNFNEDIISVLNRLSSTMRTDNEYLDNISKKKCEQYCEKNEEKVIIKKEAFLEHEAILTRVLRKAIGELLGSTYNIERKHVFDIIKLQKHNSGVLINLPNNINVYNNYGNIIIYFNNKEQNKDNGEYELTIGKQNVICNKNIKITINLIDKNTHINLKKNDCIRYFDYDKINGKIILRYRKAGDRFTNIGMSGSKKLKDIFIDMKIDKSKRDFIPLICFGSEISWIVGYKVSDKFKVSENTKRVLQIQFEREEKQ